MANNHTTVELKLAWWFRHLYVPALHWFMFVMWSIGYRVEPDKEQFTRVMSAAATFYVGGVKVRAR
jgi:hypothetical protein